MIYELRTYTVMPGKVNEYLKLSGEVGRKIRGDDYGKQEGFWFTEFGMLNQLVHLWSYADLDERERLRAALARNEAWTKEYLPRTRPLLLAQENKILSEAVPLKPPAESGHVYELRSYRCQVGKAMEWLSHFKAILPTREKYSKNVGVWHTEVSQLNQVVHLWAYASLNDRAAVRGRVLQDPEWQVFLGKTAPLLAQQEAVILNPAPFSAMR
jgi:hypothetical protein